MKLSIKIIDAFNRGSSTGTCLAAVPQECVDAPLSFPFLRPIPYQTLFVIEGRMDVDSGVMWVLFLFQKSWPHHIIDVFFLWHPNKIHLNSRVGEMC